MKVTKAGKVKLRTTGQARKLYVKLSLKARAVEGYTAYSYTKKWTVRQGRVRAQEPAVPGQCCASGPRGSGLVASLGRPAPGD